MDASLDLQRSVDETGFRKAVGAQGPVFVAVTAAGHPANEVVAVGGCERKNGYKLLVFLPRKTHQHEERLDRIGRALSLLAAALLRNRPDIFPVVKDLFIFDVICRIHRGLRAKEE